jgi:glycosyl transferase family 25
MLIPNTYIYKKCLYPTKWGGNGAGRCTDSYVVNKKCAKKLCEYIQNLSYKIQLPVDWWLNVAARDNTFNVYWSEPTIVTQGTQNGLFTSSH